MGTVERAGDDHTSEVESGEEEEIVGGGELAHHLMKRRIRTLTKTLGRRKCPTRRIDARRLSDRPLALYIASLAARCGSTASLARVVGP
ncbi:unnamed protein product [Chrysodeixis includens]|uniref:Uncharacterized protein n=1 Tax=Chrysodeixis includens TaxID=689277 RepID=A0A9N8KUU1_CHRIL|nr:unnamed protein product [Chrysodeixis includens]